jgi:peroxiredoxin Q/BCP
MRPRFFALVMAGLAVLALAGAAGAAGQPTLKAGDQAPEVEGKDQDGVAWKLRTFAGKKSVILYFYPKDDTPGCTKQACGLRDRMGELKSAGVEVAGVSFDTAESHRRFRQNISSISPSWRTRKEKLRCLWGPRGGAESGAAGEFPDREGWPDSS